MSFKKTSIVKKDNNILNIIWIISIGVIFILAFFLVKNIDFFKIEIDKEWILNDKIKMSSSEEWRSILSSIFWKKNPKEEDVDINFLLVWRWWIMNDAPNLTDTIILMKANSKKKIISMLSVPRDLYVQYPWENYYWKINGVYQRYMWQKKSMDYWMEMLGKKITQITWEKIDYYVNIDFGWFMEIVDTIWWVVIEVPQDFVDYEYPDNNWWYRVLKFKKWTWLFNWEDALKYVRSRHSTSDFDRSLRQQQVINSIKDKLLSKYLITSPWKIKELYEVITKNVGTNLGLTKVLSLAYSFRDISEFKIISSNMNTSCFAWSWICSKWWILYWPERALFWWNSVLLFNWTNISNLNTYTLPKTYSNIILNYPWIETEGLKINIINSQKIANLANSLSNDIVRYWFNITKLWNSDSEYQQTKIYYNNVPENSETINALKLFFDWEFIKVDMPKYSTDWANIEIVLGKDYVSNKKIFKF